MITLIFKGGIADGDVSNLAVKYDGTWKSVGVLLNTRYAHRSITVLNQIIHIGGQLDQ